MGVPQRNVSVINNLHQKMIDIASPIVEHWFTDVTDHDIPSVNSMEIGEVRLWSLRKTGTWLCVLNQPLNANMNFNGLVTSILRHPGEYNDGKYRLFLIHKTSDNDGDIRETTYEEMQYVNI